MTLNNYINKIIIMLGVDYGKGKEEMNKDELNKLLHGEILGLQKQNKSLQKENRVLKKQVSILENVIINNSKKHFDNEKELCENLEM